LVILCIVTIMLLVAQNIVGLTVALVYGADPFYGVLIGSWPVTTANAVCLVLSATILAMKWRFSRG